MSISGVYTTWEKLAMQAVGVRPPLTYAYEIRKCTAVQWLPSGPGGRRIRLMEIIPKPKNAASFIGVATVGLAIAATAVGALAIGALAIGRLAVRQGRIEKLSIGELTVDKLIVTERQPQ
jgi:hypothetical protein